MATNGNLNFTNVNKVTFEGVGAAPNAVIDTTTGNIGVGVDNPAANLHVVGNCFVSTNMDLGGVLNMGVVNVAARHTLEAITALGASTPSTLTLTNTGTSLVASGDVTVDTNTFHVDATNNMVGMGTTSPSAPLSILTSTGNHLRLHYSDAWYNTIERDSSGHFNIRASDGAGGITTQMTILSNGNVGFGTSDPQRLLHLKRTGAATFQRIQNVNNNNGCGIEFMRGDTDTWGATTWSDWRINNTAHLDFGVKFTGTDIPSVLHLNAYGNVGVSTTDPSAKLHVFNEADNTGTGDAFIPGLTGNTSNRKPTECLRLQGKYRSIGSGALLRFTNQHNSGTFPNTGEYNLAGIAGYDHDNGWGGGLAFYTSGGTGSGGDNLSPRMIIDSNGNVSVGTIDSTASARLHVERTQSGDTISTGNATFCVLVDVEPNYGKYGLFQGVHQSTGTPWLQSGRIGTMNLGGSTSDTFNILLNPNGSIIVVNGTNYSSDDRIKSNEQYIEHATETLLKLKPQTYDKKSMTNTGEWKMRESGLIAQDVWYDTPELRHLVSHDKNADIPVEKPFVDDDPTKDPDYSSWGEIASLNYEGLIAYLIKSNQEIYTELQAEKEKSRALADKVKTLEDNLTRFIAQTTARLAS